MTERGGALENTKRPQKTWLRWNPKFRRFKVFFLGMGRARNSAIIIRTFWSLKYPTRFDNLSSDWIQVFRFHLNVLPCQPPSAIISTVFPKLFYQILFLSFWLRQCNRSSLNVIIFNISKLDISTWINFKMFTTPITQSSKDFERLQIFLQFL